MGSNTNITGKEPIMETILILALSIVVIGLLSGSPSHAPQPPILIIQAEPIEAPARGKGCLTWIFVGLLVIVVLGMVPW
jgi:hypothetical protein